MTRTVPFLSSVISHPRRFPLSGPPMGSHPKFHSPPRDHSCSINLAMGSITPLGMNLAEPNRRHRLFDHRLPRTSTTVRLYRVIHGSSPLWSSPPLSQYHHLHPLSPRLYTSILWIQTCSKQVAQVRHGRTPSPSLTCICSPRRLSTRVPFRCRTTLTCKNL